jgi:acyl-CoA synthetase (AMP-forming)/AMP-acid ligase II/alkylation response protein AidB-like acyl-CoA dehydrogenase/acyl carrier protein
MTSSHLYLDDETENRATLIDALRARAAERGPALAYRFLTTGDLDGPVEEVTYQSLERKARALGAWLAKEGGVGERVLLLYPSGTEFIRAFYGCLYGGGVAVPAYPPDPARLERTLPRLRAIVRDSGARFVFTTAAIAQLASAFIAQAPELAALRWVATDLPIALESDGAPLPALTGQSLAFLQYTSGSTGTPKGVMVSHANLLANCRMVISAFKHQPLTHYLSWLPFYHDMGLIGIILQSMQMGGECTLMAPEAFLRRPMRWLQAISRYRAQVTSAPNFGYELCVKKATDAEIAALDLSCWEGACNGAEPVRKTTLDRFAARFAPAGFRPQAFSPCYGLAEATLVVSGTRWDQAPPACTVSAAGLERDDVIVLGAGAADGRALMPCGSPEHDGQRVAIVHPETRAALPAGRVGEIWVRGANVALGYWQKPEETAAMFGARIAGSDDGPYLRTGDLGFVHGGQLYITGRQKDLLIVNGKNRYPQDIELSAERSHPLVRPGCSAAFSVEIDGGERCVVVAEVESKKGPVAVDEVAAAIRAAVAAEHELALHAVVLLPAGAIAKTSSGKIQRRACRADFLARKLGAVHEWTAPVEAPAPVAAPAPTAPAPRVDDRAGSAARADALIAWLRDSATRLGSRMMDERRRLAPHVVVDLGNHGALGLQVPRCHGGLELNHRDTFRVCEQLGAIDLTLAMSVGVHVFLGTRPVMAAPQALRDELLPRLAQGRELAGFAAGSNPETLATRAVPDGDGWRLSGEQSWIGSWSRASVIHVFAEQRGARGISGFAVRQGRPGLRLDQNRVHLDDVYVDAADQLGWPGDGMDVAEDAMAMARYGIAAASLGAMKRALQLMLRHARGRAAAAGRLLDDPATRTRMNDALMAVAALERLVYAVADKLDAGVTVPSALAILCKVAGAELAGATIDTRALRIFDGPTETLQERVGAQLVAGGGELATFVETELGAPSCAVRLAIDGAIIHERWRDHGVDGSRWAALQAGQVATWAVLAATSPSDSPERAWINYRWMQARAAALAERHDAFPAGDRLADQIAGLARSIGDVEPTLAAEDDAAGARAARPRLRAVPAPAPIEPRPAAAAPTARHIEDWIAAWLVQKLGLPASVVRPDRAFADFGMDSLNAVELAQALQDWLGRPIDETVTWSHATPAALAAHLAQPAPRPAPELSDEDLASALAAELEAAAR